MTPRFPLSLLLLSTLLLGACSSGSDLSRTTFQKKRYSRGYYVHHAKNRQIPDAPQDHALATPEGLGMTPSSTVEVAPSVVAVDANSDPIQKPRQNGVHPPSQSIPIPAREVAGIAPLSSADAFHGVDMEADPAPAVKQSLHWSTWLALGTFLFGLIPGMYHLLFITCIPAFVGILMSGPQRKHVGRGLAIALFIASLLAIIIWLLAVMAFVSALFSWG